MKTRKPTPSSETPEPGNQTWCRLAQELGEAEPEDSEASE